MHGPGRQRLEREVTAMAEPRTKARILERLEAERDALARLLSTLRPVEMLVPGVVAGRSSVKDVLAHLADWEEHMLLWLDAARGGERVRGPDQGLTWRQLGQFNERIHQAHRDERLDLVLDYFEDAHARFMEMVEAMPEDELLERGRYPFLGKQAIYDWLVNYADHDAWGAKRIRAWREAREGAPAGTVTKG